MSAECGNCRYYEPQAGGNGYHGRCGWLFSLPKGIGYDLLSVINPTGGPPTTMAGDSCDHHRPAAQSENTTRIDHE